MATGNTVRLHRVLSAPPARVYKAFVDPDALVRWWPPYGILATMLEFTPGRGYRMAFVNFSTGSAQSFTVTFDELVEHQRIRHTVRFDDPNLPGEMHLEISFRSVICGTELTITQAGIPEAIPVEMCYLGWQEGLEQLARLVTPNIPDGA
jgi:uncharacterized protein YndB with AHSA1/START domain